MRSLISHRIEEISEYISEIEYKFDRDKSSLKSTASDEDPQSDEDYYYLEGLAEDYYTIDTVFVSIHRRSILVSIYSFLEDSMNGLCRYSQNKNNYSLTLEDLRGKGIIRAREYLVKVAELNFDVVNVHWEQIKKLNQIRNCIIHAEGDINKMKGDKIKEIVRQDPNLDLEFERRLIIKKEYIDSSIEAVKQLLVNIYNQALTPVTGN